jgi:hypothetical protein
MYLDLFEPGVIRATGVYERGGGITQILRHATLGVVIISLYLRQDKTSFNSASVNYVPHALSAANNPRTGSAGFSISQISHLGPDPRLQEVRVKFLLFKLPESKFLPREPDCKNCNRQWNGGCKKPPPAFRDLELLVPKLVFLKVEECHAEDGLETGQPVKGGKTESRYTEIKVPGKKNMVTAAIVIIDELSRWASRAIADVDFDIWRLISLSTCVERCNALQRISITTNLALKSENAANLPS